MKLAEAVKTFLYNYPAQHHKKELVKLVELAEKQYIDQIEALNTRIKKLEEQISNSSESKDEDIELRDAEYPTTNWSDL